MIKKIISLVLCILIFLSTLSIIPVDATVDADKIENVVMKIDTNRILINKTHLVMTTKDQSGEYVTPRIVNHVTLVPFDYIAQILGAETEWNASTGLLKVISNDITVSMKVGESIVYVEKNGEGEITEVIVNTPAQLINGVLYAPIRAISEGTQSDVEYRQDGNNHYVVIRTHKNTSSFDSILDSGKEKLETSYIPVTGITMNKTNLTLYIEGSNSDGEQLYATVAPSDATYNYPEWSTDNSNVISVDSDGYVKAKSAGTAIVIAKGEDNDVTAQCTVTVIETFKVESIQIIPSTMLLELNDDNTKTGQLSVEFNPLNSTNKNVIWHSSDSLIVSVDNDGRIIGKTEGTATITATSEDGSKISSCKVTVVMGVRGITLDKTETTITLDEIAQLQATITPNNATNKKIIWSSSNSDIVSIDSTGKITGQAVGNVIITAKTEDGDYKTTCTVNVVVPVSGIILNKATTTLEIIGDSYATEKLIATVYPSNATNQTITWSSSNTNIATIDSYGNITAVSAGTATVTAKSQDGEKQANCIVMVESRVTKIMINKNMLELEIYGTYDIGTETLIATVSPSNATNQAVTWTSSNLEVATVDATGKVTAVSGGTALITVTTADGNKTDICTVTVNQIDVDVTVTPSQVDILIGDITPLTAKVENAKNPDVTWTSSNDKVVTVNEKGEVTAVGLGTAVITATMNESGLKDICTVTVSYELIMKLDYNQGYANGSVIDMTGYEATIRDKNTRIPLRIINQAFNGDLQWISPNITKITVNDTSYTFIANQKNVIKTDLTTGISVNLSMEYPVTYINGKTYITASDVITVFGGYKWYYKRNVGEEYVIISNRTLNNPQCYDKVDIVKSKENWYLVDPTGITLNKTSAQFSQANSEVNTFKLEATVNPVRTTISTPKAVSQHVVWSSSNSKVASVDNQGNVSVKGHGTVIITATDVAGNTAECVITSLADVAIKVNSNEWIVNGKKQNNSSIPAIINKKTYVPTVLFRELGVDVLLIENNTVKFTYNNTVCTVRIDSNVITMSNGKTFDLGANMIFRDKSTWIPVSGIAQALGFDFHFDESTYAILISNLPLTALQKNDKMSEAKKLFVPITSLNIKNKKNIELKYPETYLLTYTYEPFNATFASNDIKWTSSNPKVVSIDSVGRMRTHSGGTVTITLSNTNDSLKDFCTVSCKVYPESISIAKTAILEEGERRQFYVTYTPTFTSEKTLFWTSSNKNIVTVDEEGIITGIKQGTAEITATDLQGHISTCTVTVYCEIGIKLNSDLKRLNDKQSSLKTKPKQSSSKEIIIPIDILKDIGVDVTTDSNTNKTTLKYNGITCVVTANSNKISKTQNGQNSTITMADTAQFIGNVLYIPVKDITTALGFSFYIDKVTYGMVISSIPLDERIKTNRLTKAGNLNVPVSKLTVVNVHDNYVPYTRQEKGKGFTLFASIEPFNATNQTITWGTSNSNVIVTPNSITSTGYVQVKSISAGKSIVTASADNGKLSKTVEVDVIVYPTKISVTKQLTLYKGQTNNIKTTFTPSDTTEKNLTFTSSNSNIASVDSSGKVTAKSSGTAIITVKDVKDNTDTCTVTVWEYVGIKANSSEKYVNGIKVTGIPKPIIKNNKFYIHSQLLQDAGASVLYNQSTQLLTMKANDITCTVKLNSNVLTVKKGNQETKITLSVAAEKVGNAVYIPAVDVIQALGLTYYYDSATDAIVISSHNDAELKAKLQEAKMLYVPVSSMTLSTTSKTVEKSTSFTIAATITPSNASDKVIKWSSSNTSVAKVDSNGKVTASGAGTATITASVDGGKVKRTCTVKVIVYPTSIIISRNSTRVSKGNSVKIGITFVPSDTTERGLTWVSSNNNVAMVDSFGKVTAQAKGTATVTAKDVKGHTVSCNVEVYIAVNSVSVTPTSLKDKVIGTSFQLKATVLPANADNKKVTWNSGNTKVATVTSSGVVTFVGQGATDITVTTADGSKKAVCKVSTFTPVVVNNLKIYQTKETYTHDKNGKFSEDLLYSDMTDVQLYNRAWIGKNFTEILTKTENKHEEEWQKMCTTLFTRGSLENVVVIMIDRFNKGKGADYVHPILTKAAEEHPSTQAYISNVKGALHSVLNEYNGDITKFKYVAASRDNNPLIKKMQKLKIKQPVFNTLDDMQKGLTIAVDSLHGNEIVVRSYKFDGKNYSGVLTFTLYDHFGLDSADVDKFGYLAGFRSWYILQHYSKYNGRHKPFVTKMRFAVPFSGTIK